jgi:hypothetical protein
MEVKSDALSSCEILQKAAQVMSQLAKQRFHERLLQSIKDSLDLPGAAKDTDILKVIKAR